jgi:hypothetical protein
LILLYWRRARKMVHNRANPGRSRRKSKTPLGRIRSLIPLSWGSLRMASLYLVIKQESFDPSSFALLEPGLAGCKALVNACSRGS